MADIAASFVPNATNGNPSAPGYLEITGDGAITIADGRVFLSKGSAAAITLANPPVAMNGATLIIISTTAYAHVITYTAGFGGGTTSRDVATFGGAIDDGLVIVAYKGVWHVSSTRNVSFG